MSEEYIYNPQTAHKSAAGVPFVSRSSNATDYSAISGNEVTIGSGSTTKLAPASSTPSGTIPSDYNTAKAAAAAYTGPDPMHALDGIRGAPTQKPASPGLATTPISPTSTSPTSTSPTSTSPTSTSPASTSPLFGGTGLKGGGLDSIVSSIIGASDAAKGGSSGGGSGAAATPSRGTGYSDATLLAQALKEAGVTVDPYQLPTIDGPNPERLEHVDTTELQNLLQQIVASQAQQANNQIDYGVEQGVNELTRAMEDAAGQYQTQRNQATADELRALDNQALYAEARGDRGGIGEAQYASIQNTAAQNRRAVNDAQTKLGTDTMRQISDLRSKGEFQKADQLLSITQNYLSQLMSLEQWALEANMSVDEFNSRLQQWVDEYNMNVQQFLTDLDLSAAQLTGVFSNGKQTAAAKEQLRESLASSGSALLSAGVLPSRQQLEAMGLTEVQAKAYINKVFG